MKMYDVIVPNSETETVKLDDYNADYGLFLLFNENDDFIGVVTFNDTSRTYQIETATNGKPMYRNYNTNKRTPMVDEQRLGGHLNIIFLRNNLNLSIKL